MQQRSAVVCIRAVAPMHTSDPTCREQSEGRPLLYAPHPDHQLVRLGPQETLRFPRVRYEQPNAAAGRRHLSGVGDTVSSQANSQDRQRMSPAQGTHTPFVADETDARLSQATMRLLQPGVHTLPYRHQQQAGAVGSTDRSPVATTQKRLVSLSGRHRTLYFTPTTSTPSHLI